MTSKFLERFASLFASWDSASSKPHDIEQLKREWIGKEGIIKQLFAELKNLSPEEKPLFAAEANKLKTKVEEFFQNASASKQQEAEKHKLLSQFIDFSLPSESPGLGSLHPITIAEMKMASVLKPFGFRNVLGPEIETEYYCFDALNIPKHHPARDMQDTFYTADLADAQVLRTHTTSVQARVLEEKKLPVKIASFGKVYRNETEDASHQAMFHQFDLVWVEQGLTLSHLMGLIEHIFKELFGKKRKVRFVPKFYPYTEPSIGAQVDCSLCHGKGCPACGGAGWVTVGGAGMIHRKVLLEFGYNPEEVTGFAFGLGTARLASQMSGIPKLKMLYDSDVRVLGRGALKRRTAS